MTNEDFSTLGRPEVQARAQNPLWWLGIVLVPPVLAVGLALLATNPLSEDWGFGGLMITVLMGLPCAWLLSGKGRRSCGIDIGPITALTLFTIFFFVGGIILLFMLSWMWAIWTGNFRY